MERERRILHCDMNSFYASVELLEHPELKDVPVAVAGDPESRHGIILAKNEAAKKYGVVTAETIQSALRKCPGLQFLPPHHEKYSAISKKLNAIYLEYTDLVEPFSVDESWLDVTASQSLFGSAEQIAEEIHERVRAELGLTLSIGVSFNKTFAKMGSEYKKPDATTVITRDNFRELLWPLPVGDFFFVGKKTAANLKMIGINTIGDLAKADPDLLTRRFGVSGASLHSYANGMDTAPVRRFTDRDPVKSVGHGMTFKRNLRGYDDVSLAVTELSDRVSVRMRRYGLRAAGVKVEITEPDFKRTSRQKKLTETINTAAAIRKTALALIDECGFMNRPIRLLTITAINLTDQKQAGQMTIFDLGAESDTRPQDEKDENLENAMDEIRKKFGSTSIRFAHVLGNDVGIDDDTTVR